MTDLTWNKMPWQRPCWESAVIETGLVDEKGRSVGGYAEIYGDHGVFVNGQYVTKFALRILAARNGKRYGAAATPTLFDKLEEAQAAAPAKLAAQAKRYAKKYGAR